MQQHDPRNEQTSPPGNERPADRIEHMHDVLTDPYRRAILYYLQEEDEPAGVREVAEQVLEWCREELQMGADADAERAREWLLRIHVLSMHEFGVITYDAGRDSISLPDDVSITITPHWEE